MKNYLATICAMVFSWQAAAETAIPDPESWYREDYAALWAEKPGEKVEAMLRQYHTTIETHSADGTLSRDSKQDWLVPPLRQWLSEGWLNAELKQLKTDRINATTTSFKASWLDRYSNAPDEMSCGWYLADVIDGRWQFTSYADLECASHGL